MVPDLVDKRLIPDPPKPVTTIVPVPVVPVPVVPVPDIKPIVTTGDPEPVVSKKISLNYICLALTFFIFYILWA